MTNKKNPIVFSLKFTNLVRKETERRMNEKYGFTSEQMKDVVRHYKTNPKKRTTFHHPLFTQEIHKDWFNITNQVSQELWKAMEEMQDAKTKKD